MHIQRKPQRRQSVEDMQRSRNTLKAVHFRRQRWQRAAREQGQRLRQQFIEQGLIKPSDSV